MVVQAGHRKPHDRRIACPAELSTASDGICNFAKAYITTRSLPRRMRESLGVWLLWASGGYIDFYQWC